MTKTVQHGSVSIPNFSLESGEQLDEIHLAYEQCGPIDAPDHSRLSCTNWKPICCRDRYEAWLVAWIDS